jgi:AcrR family transcriptional regulator
VTAIAQAASPRRAELLEQAYRYVLQHGLGGMSLRPLAAAVGSSPRVLLFLFGSKDDLVRALLARAREDELALLDAVRTPGTGRERSQEELAEAAARTWQWLAAPEHRALLRLWVEGYARSLVGPAGPWRGFAEATVADWLTVLEEHQPATTRHTPSSVAQRTLVLAVLRGALLDLLATGDAARVTAAVASQLAAWPATSG